MDLASISLWQVLLANPEQLLSGGASLLLDQTNVDAFGEAVHLHLDGLREAGVPEDCFSGIAVSALKLQSIVRGAGTGMLAPATTVAAEMGTIHAIIDLIDKAKRAQAAENARRGLDQLRFLSTQQMAEAARAILGRETGEPAETRRYVRQIRLVPVQIALLEQNSEGSIRNIAFELLLRFATTATDSFTEEDVVRLLALADKIEIGEAQYNRLMDLLWETRRDLFRNLTSDTLREDLSKGSLNPQARLRWLLETMESSRPQELYRLVKAKKGSRLGLYRILRQIIEERLAKQAELAAKAIQYLILNAVLKPFNTKNHDDLRFVLDLARQHPHLFTQKHLQDLRFAFVYKRSSEPQGLEGKAVIRKIFTVLRTLRSDLFASDVAQ